MSKNCLRKRFDFHLRFLNLSVLSPGKQAVVVMSCENQHMPEDLIIEPGLVMIFAHGVEWEHFPPVIIATSVRLSQENIFTLKRMPISWQDKKISHKRLETSGNGMKILIHLNLIKKTTTDEFSCHFQWIIHAQVCFRKHFASGYRTLHQTRSMWPPTVAGMMSNIRNWVRFLPENM